VECSTFYGITTKDDAVMANIYISRHKYMRQGINGPALGAGSVLGGRVHFYIIFLKNLVTGSHPHGMTGGRIYYSHASVSRYGELPAIHGLAGRNSSFNPLHIPSRI